MAREVIDAGCTLTQARDGSMLVAIYEQFPGEAWGFDAADIRKDAEDMYWPNKDLIDRITYGFRDYEEGTTRICTVSTQK